MTATAAILLNGATAITTATAPTLGNINSYNASGSALSITLPPLSTLNVGAHCIIEKNAADTSTNAITFTTNGADTFDDASTSVTLMATLEKRTLQVVLISGTKYWKVTNFSPSPGLQQALGIAGLASKLVSIGDQGYAAAPSYNVTSTAGTSEMVFTVGVAATNITALFCHSYSNTSGSDADTDPSGSITFNASLKVVSSTNPGTVTGTLYRLTFNGRTSATLDPGGRIIADALGLSVAPGDVVAVRTYLSSGTAYAPRGTYGGGYGIIFSATSPGGFVSGSDLTPPGSGAIAGSSGVYYGPSALLGRPTGADKAKSVLYLGDSIGVGVADDVIFTRPALGGQGGFVLRALSGLSGLLSLSLGSDTAANFQSTAGSFRRLGNAGQLCNSAIIEYGTNDLWGGATAATLEGINLNIATDLRRLGISKVFLTTLLPRTTSTDGWVTTTNQTPLSMESQRVAYNTWVRAQCPVNPTTLAPVAVGTPGALLAGSYGHPLTGFFETASTVESALNSGRWLPATRVATGSITSGSNSLTSSTANFLSANQEAGGDTGAAVVLVGSGISGKNIAIVSSSTAVLLDTNASTTVTNAALYIGVLTPDGIHPTGHGHYLMSQAINTALL